MIQAKHFTRRPCQQPMVEHGLKNLRCGIWAGCGLGKTSAVFDILDNLNLTQDVYPAIALGPLRVARSTWTEEAQKWSEFRHIGISPVVGTEQERLHALKQPADIYPMNYENLPWLEKVLGDKWPFVTCIADEATRLKSFRIRQGGARARALKRYAFTKVKRFIELTGTPSPQGMQDLWGQLWFLDQGQRLGRTFTAFEGRWFVYRRRKDAFTHKEYVETVILPHAQAEIHERIRDICLSVDAKDYFDLKDPIVIPVYVELDPRSRALYRAMEKELFLQIEGHDVEAFNAASKTNKCLQLANGAIYIDRDVESDLDPRAKEWKVVHDLKIEALESVIEEANGMPVLVAYNFKSDLARLKKAFPSGRLIATKKDEDDFKAGKIAIGFAHPASLGHGVDGFQYATNIGIFFGLTWNLENWMQFIERFGPVRQMQAGLDRNVFVYLIIARGTVDEDVITRQETKRGVQDILLESMKKRRILNA